MVRTPTIEDTMRLSLKSLAFVALLPLVVAACDGTDQAVTADTSPLTCTPSTFRVAGEIDGTSIDVSQPADAGGFAQDASGGDFGSINNGLDDGTLVDLHALWSSGVSVGDSTTTTATIKIPTSRFGQETFCAGAGSTLRSVPDSEGGGFQLRLVSLASGANCSVSHTGTLRACWRP
jgi:hypothetical protein